MRRNLKQQEEQLVDEQENAINTQITEENKTAVNLISRMMGAAVLSGAYVFRFLGLIPIIILMSITVIIYVLLNNYYIDAFYYTGSKTFRELSQKLFGPKMASMFDYVIVFFAMGSLTSYIVISSKAIMNLIYKYSSVTLESGLLKLIVRPVLSFCVIFPLTLLRNTKQLSKISPYSVLAICVTIFSTAYYFFHGFSDGQVVCSYKGERLTYDWSLFPNRSVLLQLVYFTKYIPSLQFTFNISTSLPIVFQELKGPLQLRRRVFKIAVAIAFGLSIALYCLISLATSVAFGPRTTDNVLDTFQPCGFVWMDAVPLVYAAVLVMAYPLVLQPPRIALMGLMKKTSKGWFSAVGLFYVVITCILACVLERIVAIFGLFSALCGFFLYFLVPLACYYKLPKLKRNSTIPSLQSQLRKGEHADNLAIALLNVFTTAGITDRARQMYSKRARSASSVELKVAKAPPKSRSLISTRAVQDFNVSVHLDKPLDPRYAAFSYEGEYNGGGRCRKRAAITWLVAAGVGCAIALVLNVMDFAK